VEPQFVRRVAAVLVAERDAEATATNALTDALGLLRAAGADAEPLPPNAVVAVFDDPGLAVRAATRLHIQTTGADREGRPAWRAGLHVDVVTMTGEGTATLAAIDRATALARLARPGTTAVTADALPALGTLHDAVLEALEHRLSPGGQVHLVVPRPPAPELVRRRLVVLLAGTVVLGGAGAVVWLRTRRSGDDDQAQVTLGVGPFQWSGADQARAWIGPALRDGLSTQLAEVSGVRVYSDEFMDFVMSRERLTPIEVANRLGIEKMVTGSVLVVGDTVHVEARIVNIATGLIEGAYVTTGREQDLLALQSDFVFEVIARLGLHLSADEERRLAAQRTTNQDALRRLLDAEGEPAPGSPTDEHRPAEPERRSSPWPDFGPRPAYADDAAAEIAAFLEEYRQATESRDVAAVDRLYVTFPPEQRAALERYCASVQELRVTISRVEVAAVGDEAVVNYTRTDDFVDVPTRRPQHVSLRLTKTLRRVDGRWRISTTR